MLQRRVGDDSGPFRSNMIAFVNHWELLVILAVVLLLFGHRLPGMARSLGSGITEFKRGLKDGASKSKDGDEKSVEGGQVSGSEDPKDGLPR